MPIVKIEKQNWETGLNKLSQAYRLCGPVEEKEFHYFKDLGDAELPDFGCLNTRLSAKGTVYPQSEDMFEYSLDNTRDDHHIMKDVPKDYSPRAVLGIRPCDAKAVELVKLNFDTADHQDPYWLRAWEATTFCGSGLRQSLQLVLLHNGRLRTLPPGRTGCFAGGQRRPLPGPGPDP